MEYEADNKVNKCKLQIYTNHTVSLFFSWFEYDFFCCCWKNFYASSSCAYWFLISSFFRFKVLEFSLFLIMTFRYFIQFTPYFSSYLFTLFVSYIHGKYVHMHDFNFSFCGRYIYYSVSYPYNYFIKKCGHGANLNRNQERKQSSYIEVRMIYVRHV